MVEYQVLRKLFDQSRDHSPSTESSTEEPKPSFRISTPNSLPEAAAPYSLAAAMVMSKGRAWSEYQGRAGSL